MNTNNHYKKYLKYKKKYIENKEKYIQFGGRDCPYNPSRSDIEGLKTEIFATAKQCIPTAIIMGGGPGSGKTSAQKKAIQRLKMNDADFAVIDVDTIMGKLFHFDNDCYSPSAATINNEFFNYAITNKYNLIFDTTARNFSWISTNVITRLKTSGYRTILVVSLLDISVALERILKRATTTGRYVDVPYARDTYRILKDVIPQYINYVDLDAIYFYDNSGAEASLIFEKYKDDIICHDSDAVVKYLPTAGCSLCPDAEACRVPVVPTSI